MPNDALPPVTPGDDLPPTERESTNRTAGSRAFDHGQDLLRAVIETNTDLILSVDAAGMVTFANGGFIGDAGARQVMNTPVDGLVAPAGRAEFAARRREILDGQVVNARLEAAGAGALAGRHCLYSMGLLRSGSAELGVIVIVSDLTELHDAWERLRSSEKLVATGRMAARIAHEINNPLAGIAGALQLIRMDTDPASPAFRYVAMVDREISRISNIVRQMYGLYRQEQEPVHVVDLIPVLGEIAILMNVEAGQKNVEIEVMPGLPQLARVQEQNLRQVLLNIVRNAIEASPEGGRINLYVERCGRCIDVVVADQGPGIAAGDGERVFEPFYTSKSPTQGRGLGLGLSISDALVRGMGGRIELDNNPAGGCLCRICLPEAGDVPAGQA
ncbi:MAG: two-component system sensor histidine kinase NtrB [Gammaproteobacteria bacterium]